MGDGLYSGGFRKLGFAKIYFYIVLYTKKWKVYHLENEKFMFTACCENEYFHSIIVIKGKQISLLGMQIFVISPTQWFENT